jgi:hypothetical protein
VDVALDLTRPSQESPEIVALSPHEFPEFQESNLLHLDAGIGFDPPQQIRAAPRSEAVPFRRVPQEADRVLHGDIIITKCNLDYAWQQMKVSKVTVPRLAAKGLDCILAVWAMQQNAGPSLRSG